MLVPDPVSIYSALAIGVPASVALVALVVRYFYDLRLTARQARLDRVGEQLRSFYGPLYSNLKLEQDLFSVFKEEHSLGDGFWQNEGDNPTDEQGVAWRKWIAEVFMPINESMLALVLERADLIEEVEIPDCLSRLNLHVASYRILMARWKSGDLSSHLPKVMFPGDALHGYVDAHYHRLKAEQRRLLGVRRKA